MEQYVTSQLAAKTADGMLAPLIDSDDDESDENSDYDSSASIKVETVKPTPMQVLKSLIGKNNVMMNVCLTTLIPFLPLSPCIQLDTNFKVYLVLGAGIAASVAAIVYAPIAITYIMGGVCIAK